MALFMSLPGEIRVAIVNRLLDYWKLDNDGEDIAPYAVVCREWQAVIERHTFSNLKLTNLRMPEFAQYVRNSRRRCLKRINLHVDLPEYFNDPCEHKETWNDKMANNWMFSTTFRGLFSTLHQWDDHEVRQGGIHLFFSMSSPSDLRNTAFDLWQRRRWNNNDIGEKRFADSYVDFVGQDEEFKRTSLLKPVYAITSLETCQLIRRSIMPAAYADIIANLPRLKEVSLDLIKEKNLLSRRLIFDRTYRPLRPNLDGRLPSL